MKIRFLMIGLLAISSSTLAVQPVHPPGLLPTAIARSLLEQDPGVAAARAGLEVALQEAGILDKSPYEWTARAAGQQRRLETGPRYNEWHVGIERSIRLPGKASADRKLGEATVEESRARYAEAMHDAARELLALWVDWLAAERGRELAESSLQSTQDSLAAVDKRVRAGDASRLDANIARAELSEQRRLQNGAKTHASVTWARLSARFPGMNREVVPTPMPLPIREGAQFWRERILAESEVMRVAQAQLHKARGLSERARADRTPDPTLGVYTASLPSG